MKLVLYRCMERMKFWTSVYIVWISISGLAQTGGQHAFSYLNQSFSAPSLSLGGKAISVSDDKAFLSIDNPALLREEHSGYSSFHESLLAGGIHFGMLHHTKKLQGDWTASANLRYVDYGTILKTDVIGESIGSFHPLDVIAGISASRALGPSWNFGFSSNVLFSQFEQYTSLGFSADVGAYYENDKQMSAGFVIKNAGVQLLAYHDKNRTPLPLNIQAGLAKKLAHAPFRFRVVAHNLQRWDLSYFDPNQAPQIDGLTGDTVALSLPGFGEKFFRHLAYQVEILLGQNVELRTGFDYNRRANFGLAARPAAAGFSFGTGFKFKRFRFDYGMMIYSQAGFQHQISLQTRLSDWRKRN